MKYRRLSDEFKKQMVEQMRGKGRKVFGEFCPRPKFAKHFSVLNLAKIL